MGQKRDFEQMEAVRLEAARLLKSGLSQAEISRKLKVSRMAVSKWNATFETHGKRGLRKKKAGRKLKFGKKNMHLDNVGRILDEEFLRNGFRKNYWTLKKIAEIFERETGEHYTESGMWHLLKNHLGIKKYFFPPGKSLYLPPKDTHSFPPLLNLFQAKSRRGKRFRELRAESYKEIFISRAKEIKK